MAGPRDYYETLGVARNADEGEIKKAFRQLARKLHPDVNTDDPAAADRFREVAEAYEVLSVAETRATYDRYGHAGVSGSHRRTDNAAQAGNFGDLFSMLFGEDLFGGGRGGGRGGPRPGGDAVTQVEITLRDAAFGVPVELPIQAEVGCERCERSGAEPGSNPRTCATCGGQGQVRQLMRTVLGQVERVGPCPTCNGRGKQVDDPCRRCRGVGRVMEERTVSVAIPAGIEHGQQVLVRGQGHAGDPGAPDGDLYVAVAVADDARFQREGVDLVTVVELTMTQAALGATLAVDTLDGAASVEFKAGTQAGEVRTLRGQGMPNVRSGRRGNLRILVNVLVPRALSGEQRRLLEQLDSALAERNYAEGGDGILGRFRRHRDGG